MTKALLVDVESTGLTDPEIIEYGAVEIILNEGFTIAMNGEVKVSRHKPSKPISYGAISTHGILDEDLDGCEPFSLEGVGFDCEYLIGQNIIYDHEALGKPDVKLIDTLALSREQWPDLDSHKLGALLAFLSRRRFKEYFVSAHTAETDIKATAYVLYYLVSILKPQSWEELHQMSEEARIPSRAPWEKFKVGGVKGHMSTVDPGYRRWYANLPDADLYILKAFERHPYQP